jgi:hypothetical protein
MSYCIAYTTCWIFSALPCSTPKDFTMEKQLILSLKITIRNKALRCNLKSNILKFKTIKMESYYMKCQNGKTDNIKFSNLLQRDNQEF